MTCPSRMIIRSYLARAFRWVLRAAVGLALSAIGPGGARIEVRAHPRSADIVFQDLSARERQAYCSYESGQFGEVGERGLNPKSELSSRRRSVAGSA
jgi:hypothetical protein